MTRGRLRVYLGAAPGVGKTYAMLSEGHRRQERGTDVVVGVVETHGRVHTAELLEGLEVIPRQVVEYRGRPFDEFDVDAVLARKPDIVLVDELAHTNVPGVRNAKRWQDVDELLDAGIDVITTVNIQHLESLNDTVEAITGIKQQETVPDAVVRAADQLELEDMAPEALRRRLAHGNVYAAEKIDAALGNYFRPGNLAALRELALLWLADRVEEGLAKYRKDHDIVDTWAARQRIVVAITGGPESATLLRRGAVVAGRGTGRDLMAVHVVRSDGSRAASPADLAELRRLCTELGGSFHTVVGDTVSSAVLEFTRSVNGTRIVVGATRHGRLRTALSPSAAEEIVKDSGDIDVQVVTHERAGRAGWLSRSNRSLTRRRRLISWTLAFLLPVIAVLILAPGHLDGAPELPVVLLVMLSAVVACSLLGGVWIAASSAIWAALLMNYWFTEPQRTLIVAQPESVVALIMFVLVGCTIAFVVDQSAGRAAEAAERRAEAEALNALAMGVLSMTGNHVRALLEQARQTFGLSCAALFEEAPDRSFTVVEAVGEPVLTNPDHADVRLDPHPGLIFAVSGRALTNAERRILSAYAAQAWGLLQHDRLAAKAADAARLREAEKARRALLAALSHDLRTPIAGLKASLQTLTDSQLTLTADDRTTLLNSAELAADRLSSLVANLLDLSRIQSGSLQPVYQPVNLDEVLRKAVIGLPAESIDIRLADEMPRVSTDPALLERAIANVVENAVRQESGGAPVRIHVGPIDGGNRVDIRICDEGPGVPADQLDGLFEPFGRIGDRAAANGDGVGLGLAVTSGMIQILGGSIDVEDTPGRGLTIVLSLPVGENQ